MRHKYSHALVSFAGPFGNVILFLVFCLLAAAFRENQVTTYFQMFSVGASLNAFLFLFNMLPIPILDGWIVFTFFIPKLNKINDEVKKGATFLVIILFFMTPLLGYFFGIGHFLTIVFIEVMSTII